MTSFRKKKKLLKQGKRKEENKRKGMRKKNFKKKNENLAANEIVFSILKKFTAGIGKLNSCRNPTD